MGIVAVVYTVVFIAKRYFDGSYGPAGFFFNSMEKSLRPKPASFGIWQIGAGTSILFNMFSTSYMAHTNAVKFYNELKDRSVTRFTRVVGIAMGAATITYAIVMTLGFKTFGLNSQGVILNNYHISKDVLATLGRAATGISIIGAHPLLFAGLRDSFLNILPPSVSSGKEAWLLSTVGLLGAATSIALLCKDVGLIVSLVGSFLGSAIVYIFPSWIYLNLMRSKKIPKGTVTKAEVLLLHLTLLFGVVIMIGGTAITLLNAFTDFFK